MPVHSGIFVDEKSFYNKTEKHSEIYKKIKSIKIRWVKRKKDKILVTSKIFIQYVSDAHKHFKYSVVCAIDVYVWNIDK